MKFGRNLSLAILILALLVLHQDYWQWDRAELVFGFLPYPLAYHAGISVAAVVLWLLAVIFCWPSGLDEEAAGKSEGDAGR